MIFRNKEMIVKSKTVVNFMGGTIVLCLQDPDEEATEDMWLNMTFGIDNPFYAVAAEAKLRERVRIDLKLEYLDHKRIEGIGIKVSGIGPYASVSRKINMEEDGNDISKQAVESPELER